MSLEKKMAWLAGIRGTCPVCGRMMRISKHGYLRRHLAGIIRGEPIVGKRICDGSGQFNKEGRVDH